MAASNPLLGLSPYMIGGDLSFGSPDAYDYGSVYQNYLNLNKQMYDNMLTGFQGLTQSVLGNIQGIGAGQMQNVADTYAQQQGAATQSLISKGLGNTTVAPTVARGINLDKAKAQNDVVSKLAGLYANTQSDLGKSLLNWMNTVSMPPPSMAPYNQMYMNKGMLDALKRGFGSNMGAGLGGGYRAMAFNPRIPFTGMGVGGGEGGGGGGMNQAAAQLPAYSQNSPYAGTTVGAGGGANFGYGGGGYGIGEGGGSYGIGAGGGGNAPAGWDAALNAAPPGSNFLGLGPDSGGGLVYSGPAAYGYGQQLGGQLGDYLSGVFGGGQPAAFNGLPGGGAGWAGMMGAMAAPYGIGQAQQGGDPLAAYRLNPGWTESTPYGGLGNYSYMTNVPGGGGGGGGSWNTPASSWDPAAAYQQQYGTPPPDENTAPTVQDYGGAGGGGSAGYAGDFSGDMGAGGGSEYE